MKNIAKKGPEPLEYHFFELDSLKEYISDFVDTIIYNEKQKNKGKTLLAEIQSFDDWKIKQQTLAAAQHLTGSGWD